jgi:Cu-Zn family superoxide dismutase
MLVGTLLMGASATAQDSPITAEAELLNQKGKKIGTATLIETKKGVKVSIQASQLPPGKHGIHFHEAGVCAPPKFSTAGEHFNPESKKHGLKGLSGPHAGDLPNLKVEKDGTVATEFTTSQVTLEPGEDSLLKKGTTALVIHAKPDDQVTQPSGASGDRIACGVITQES